MELFAPESFGSNSCFFYFMCTAPLIFSFVPIFFGGGGYALYEICSFIALIIGIYWLISAYFLSDFEIWNNGQAGHYEKGLDLPQFVGNFLASFRRSRC